MALGILFGSFGTEAQTVHVVAPGDTLSRLASQHYGDTNAWPAIMLATNTGNAIGEDFPFINDANAIAVGDRVLLPSLEKARITNALWTRYNRAVVDVSLPEPWEISTRLVALSEPGPLRVVTWARTGQFEQDQRTTSSEVWVTVVPRLQRFCQGLPDRDALVLRLEQRLGVPPRNNKTTMVELIVSNPRRDLFRPCADPALDTTTCALGPPADNVDAAHRSWFFEQYFKANATAQPARYPWTTLGYTYDWAPGATEEGESEFVIKAGAEIEVVSMTPTEAYCRPSTP